MKNKTILKALIIWTFFIPLAIINGIVRNLVYGPFVSELLAHQISSVVLSTAFLAVTVLLFKSDAAKLKNRYRVYLGLMWLLMTMAFEFLFGHFIIGTSWTRLLEDYNLLHGRIWIFVLGALLFTPAIAGKLGNKNQHENSTFTKL
jgi:hypothetical protein